MVLIEEDEIEFLRAVDDDDDVRNDDDGRNNNNNTSARRRQQRVGQQQQQRSVDRLTAVTENIEAVQNALVKNVKESYRRKKRENLCLNRVNT